MKKLLTLALTALLLCSVAFGVFAEIEPPKRPIPISFGTSIIGGNFYVVGGGVAQLINNHMGEYYNCTAEETGGSSANLQMIEAGEIEIGITQASANYEAMTGTAAWSVDGQPATKLRGLVACYPSYLTMYTLASSNINSLSDYKGKTVSVGANGAAMDRILRASFAELDLGIAQFSNDGNSQAASAIGDGFIDVACCFSYPPFPAISELEASKELHFVGLTDEEQAYFSDKYPFYTPATMPAGSYKGNADYDVTTVGEWVLTVISADMDEDYVYLLAKTLFENTDELKAIYEPLENIKPENQQYFNIPLHAGVVRYLKEVGVEVPAELIPEEYAE